MKNNKGVTLVELLVVIVVMGIIAGFAIPAVGNIIENANKDAVLNDAIQVENAARLYCSSNTDANADAFCANSGTTYDFSVDYTGTAGAPETDFTSNFLDGYLENFTYTSGTVSKTASGEWTVSLTDGTYSFSGIPSNSDRQDVS